MSSLMQYERVNRSVFTVKHSLGRVWIGTFVLVLTIFAGMTGTAQDTGQAQQDAENLAAKTWRFSLAPYAWLPLGNTTKVGERPFCVTRSVEMGDILDALQFGGFVHMEGSRGQNGIFADVFHSVLSDNVRAVIPRDYRWLNVPVDGALKCTAFELGGLHSWDWVSAQVDLFAAARYLDVNMEAEWNSLNVGMHFDQIEPVAGGQLRLRLSELWAVVVRGDVGGFGIGNRISENGDLVVKRQLSRHVAIGFGYRVYHLDITQEGSHIESRIDGPVFGLAFDW